LDGERGQAETAARGASTARPASWPGASDRIRRIDASIVAHAFGETANPDDYVPREACEEVLDRLERVLFDLGEPAVLLAPAGMGKSLLLRVLARRNARRARPIELAYGALAFEDLCEWTVRLAGETVTGLPSEDLLHLLGHQRLLLAIDDASSLPERTAAALGAFARAQPTLHVVLTDAEGPATDRMLEAFGQPALRVHLTPPMSVDEACSYMSRRLERWGASRAMLERLRTADASRAHALAEGVPRRLHAVAQELLLAGPDEDA
jgi:hypothetical protein